MSQAHAAAAPDRLPWLADEPASSEKRHGNRRSAPVWFLVILIVAALSYWIGAHRWERSASPTKAGSSSSRVVLPQARPAEPPQPQVALPSVPQVRPEPQAQVRMSAPRLGRRSISKRPASNSETIVAISKVNRAAAAVADNSSPQASSSVPTAANQPLTVWPAWQSEGAHGRIVRIGAFGTRFQAKLGWQYMVHAYPAVAHLRATVVSDNNSRGRHFYRFQIGTTSQAHSEVLCQRMEKIHLSCAVVGLPWKPHGVER